MFIEPRHEITVGNVGTVYSGTNSDAAQRIFAEYQNHSLHGYGKAAGKSVYWMIDGDLREVFIGSLKQD